MKYKVGDKFRGGADSIATASLWEMEHGTHSITTIYFGLGKITWTECTR